MKRIVVIGGGTGTYNTLIGLKNFYVDITAIVSMTDDGGSTGILRDELGILPPGDIRKCLVALSTSDKLMRRLFQHRFGNELDNHSFGNLFLTAMSQILRSEEKAIEEVGKILKIKGKVVPVTLDNTRLSARLENGEVIRGERNIDVPKHDTRIKIREVFLNSRARANRDAVFAIKEADLIVIGPGDLYTSLIPNLLVEGISEAIKNSSAKKVYVCNPMTKHGETDGFKAHNFVEEIEKYLGKNSLDFVLYSNDSHQNKLLLRKYASEKSFPVVVDEGKHSFKAKFIQRSLSSSRKFIRHDPNKLSRAIVEILREF